MFSPEFEDCISRSHTTIRNNLHVTWKQFGSTDFPVDSGIQFRNRMFAFIEGFLSEIRGEGPGHDAWNAVNLPLLQRLNEHQIVRVVGLLHMYAISLDFANGKTAPKQFSISLDWVMNSYRLPGTASVEWHTLAAKDGESFEWKGSEKMYSEIAAITGAGPFDRSNAKGWCGLAFVIQHGMASNEKFAEYCDECFSE